jgi:hypothetical protein
MYYLTYSARAEWVFLETTNTILIDMKLWNILYETPDMTEERHVKAPTMAEAMKKVLPEDTYYCWGQEVEDMS